MAKILGLPDRSQTKTELHRDLAMVDTYLTEGTDPVIVEWLLNRVRILHDKGQKRLDDIRRSK